MKQARGAFRLHRNRQASRNTGKKITVEVEMSQGGNDPGKLEVAVKRRLRTARERNLGRTNVHFSEASASPPVVANLLPTSPAVPVSK